MMKSMSLMAVVVASLVFLPCVAAQGEVVSVLLTTDDLGLGSTDINYAGNGSAVEADRLGKLVTSAAANVGSVLTVQKDGTAGAGTGSNPLFVTITARTYLGVDTAGAPAGYDFQGGVICLSNDGGKIEEEGLGVRAFGIDLDSGSLNYGKRYVNADLVGTNGHGFQMEGSKEISGGFQQVNDGVGSNFTWAEFDADGDDVPSNNPPHVNEDVTFDFAAPVFGDTVSVLLTKIKAGGRDDDSSAVAVDVVINMLSGGPFIASYGNVGTDAPAGLFTVPTGFDGDDNILEMNFSALGFGPNDLVTSFTIGARHDTADGDKETDEHFLIHGFSADVPEPGTMALLAIGGTLSLLRRRKRAVVA
jgi:hypothetical protein